MNRGLTRQEAEDGVQPLVLTRDEWRAMHIGSLKAEYDAILRTYTALRAGIWDHARRMDAGRDLCD